VLLPKCVYFP
jgi:polygalacturonase